MHTKQTCIEIRNYLQESFRTAIRKDALSGFTAPQKSIPSKYFYDVRGSRLFERICCLPEYYPTRTELAILKRTAPDIMRSFSEGDIIELGSGANEKIRIFLDSADEASLPRLRYIPVDVSESALKEASEELLDLYPSLAVLGIIADFTRHIDTVPGDNPRVIMFLGSTIGNFDKKMQKQFLRSVAGTMKPGDRFIIGFDMIKPKDTLEAAYNDSLGVTSEFNKNVLRVLNRELNANFIQSHFDHVAFFNEEKERVEMHLRANRETRVIMNDLEMEIGIGKHETIHTENSYKFSRSRVEEMVSGSGLTIKKWNFDSRKWFSLVETGL